MTRKKASGTSKMFPNPQKKKNKKTTHPATHLLGKSLKLAGLPLWHNPVAQKQRLLWGGEGEKIKKTLGGGRPESDILVIGSVKAELLIEKEGCSLAEKICGARFCSTGRRRSEMQKRSRGNLGRRIIAGVVGKICGRKRVRKQG